MPSLCVTPAIVLRSWPFGESDKIVSFLTQDYGKVTGIAKGAKRSRKRFVNTLEIFAWVRLRFLDRPHSTLAFIQASDLIQPFKNLTTSLEKIVHASHLLETTDSLIVEREANPLLYDHLKDGLVFLDDHESSLGFLTYFELKLLQLAGYQPSFNHCRRCSKPFHLHLPCDWRFSPRDGGILCESCSGLRREAVSLSVAALAALTALQQASGFPLARSAVPSSVLKEALAVLLRFIQFQINRELKSTPFVDEFSFA
jgi:DNA repair protein RecO (recombination protein O)